MNNFKPDHFDYTVIKRIKVSVYIFIVIVIHGHHLQLWFTGHKTSDIKIKIVPILLLYNFVARLLNIYLTCLCMYFWLCTKHCQQFFFSLLYCDFSGIISKGFLHFSVLWTMRCMSDEQRIGPDRHVILNFLNCHISFILIA